MFYREGDEPESATAKAVRQLVERFVTDLHRLAPKVNYTVLIQTIVGMHEDLQGAQMVQVESEDNFFLSNINGDRLAWGSMSDLMIEGIKRNLLLDMERNN